VDIDVGTISSTPYQDGMDILFAGQYNDLLPDFRINFSGKAGINMSTILFQTEMAFRMCR